MHASPAEAGVHLPVARAAATWVPAFAGTADRSRFHASRVGEAGGGLGGTQRSYPGASSQFVSRSRRSIGGEPPLFGVKEPIIAQVKALRVEDVAEHTFMRRMSDTGPQSQMRNESILDA
jgi:hypothetical protein